MFAMLKCRMKILEVVGQAETEMTILFVPGPLEAEMTPADAGKPVVLNMG